MAFKMKAGKEGPMKKNYGIGSPLAVDIFGSKKRKAKKKALAAMEDVQKNVDKKTTGKVTDQDTEAATTSVKKSRGGRVDLNTKESKREIAQAAQDIANKNKKSSAVRKNKMTAAEMQAASLAAAKKTKGIKVSGGKKTVPGSFVQHPGTTERGGGSSTAGNSTEHAALRVKAKNRTISASERKRLAALEAATEKAYKAIT